MSQPHDPRGPAFRRAPETRPQADCDAMPPSHARPTHPAAASAAPTRRSGLLPALWFALAAGPGLAAAGPALEYGPEAEARFLDRCIGSGATMNSCHRLMEQLQAQLGYGVFIDLVDGGAEGFGRVRDDRAATAAPTASTVR